MPKLTYFCYILPLIFYTISIRSPRKEIRYRR